jgi:hypothetical protein
LGHSATPFSVMGFFEIGSCELFVWGWLWTGILLISATWVTRITGVSHWHPALCSSWDEFLISYSIWMCVVARTQAQA